MLNFNGKLYAKNNAEFVSTLFKSSGTANGFYKKLKSGIKLFNLQNELIAFIAKGRKGGNSFVVSASVKDNKARYMFGLCSLDSDYLGLSGLGYMQEIEAAENAINQLFK